MSLLYGWLSGPARLRARRVARAVGILDAEETTAFTEGYRGDSRCPYRGRSARAFRLGRSWREQG